MPLRLIARLVRPGKNGGWVAGDLDWHKLDALGWSRDYSEPQLRLLRELYVLYQASGSHGGYYGYHYGNDRSIEFSSIDSRQLWPLLDEAAAVGLRLVYPGKRGGLAGYEEAGFCLDVTRGAAGELRIVPVIRAADGEPAAPVAFIGAEGHGAVCVDAAEAAGGEPGSWRFRLVRLIRPVPPPLQQMALGGESLQVPAAEELTVPGPVLPAAAARRGRDLLGRIVHPARDLRARPGAAGQLPQRSRARGELGMGVPGRRLAAARATGGRRPGQRVPGPGRRANAAGPVSTCRWTTTACSYRAAACSARDRACWPRAPV